MYKQPLTSEKYYKIFKDQAKRLLRAVHYHEIVPAEIQNREIEQLKETLHYEKFFFVINNSTFTTEHVYGTEHWLGYKAEEFTIEKYCSIIHPTHLSAQLINNFELLESLIAGEWPIRFMSHRFISTIALQHGNGEYLLYKRLTWPFQHDKQYRLLSYLNEFTLLGPYNSEFYSARVTDANGNTIEWYDELLQRTKKAFAKEPPFSVQELRLLHKLAYYPAVTNAAIAKMFKIKESSVITYKKRILSKSEKFFHQRFKTAKDTAEYLKTYGLL